MDRFFHVTEKGSTIRTEIMAGITTFMAMAYILMVNAGMFSNPFGDGTDVLGVSYGAIYVATAISAVVGTLLIGLLSNLPLAQASGMGLNAYFVYTVCGPGPELCQRPGAGAVRRHHLRAADRHRSAQDHLRLHSP